MREVLHSMLPLLGIVYRDCFFYSFSFSVITFSYNHFAPKVSRENFIDWKSDTDGNYAGEKKTWK